MTLEVAVEVSFNRSYQKVSNEIILEQTTWITFQVD